MDRRRKARARRRAAQDTIGPRERPGLPMKTPYPSFPASRFGPPEPRAAGADAARRRDDLVAAFAAVPRREGSPWVAAPGAPGPEALPPAPSILFHQARVHLGDTLWATPLFAEIARRFPGAAVTVVGPPVAAEVLAGVPGVVRVIPYLPGDPSPPWPPSPVALPPPGRGGKRTAPFDAALFAFARRPESRWLAEWAAAAGVPFRVNLEYVDPALDASRVADFATHEGWFSWGSIFSPRMLLHLLDPLVPGGIEEPERVRPCFLVTDDAAATGRPGARRARHRGGAVRHPRAGRRFVAALAGRALRLARRPARRRAGPPRPRRGLGRRGGPPVEDRGPDLSGRATEEGPRRYRPARRPRRPPRARPAPGGNDSGPIHLADAVGARRRSTSPSARSSSTPTRRAPPAGRSGTT